MLIITYHTYIINKCVLYTYIVDDADAGVCGGLMNTVGVVAVMVLEEGVAFESGVFVFWLGQIFS